MRYGSVCSGIEAASLAWESLGWSAAWFAEIEKFPSKVLAARWPHVPNLGDMCQLPTYLRMGFIEAPDVLVGGTPCQAYSVAGKREGLADERGQLTLKFVEVADAIDSQRPESPCIVVWENVPGVLSDRGNAFGCFLGDLVGEDCTLEPPGGKWSNCGVVHGPTRSAAWRVLDAQYFGVAQRRRRVFVVASAREGFDPAAVLFEFEGVRRDSAPSREKGEGFTAFTPSSINAYREGLGTLRANGGDNGGGSENLICMAHGQAGAEIRSEGSPSLTCNHEAPIIFNWNAQPGQMNFSTTTTTPSLTCSQGAAVCQYGSVAGSLTARHDSSPCADRGMNVVAVPHVDTLPTMRAGAVNGGSGHGARSGDSKDEYITPCVAFEPGVAKRDDAENRFTEELCPTLRRHMGDNQPAVAYNRTVAFKPGQSEAAGGTFVTEEYAPTLQSSNNGSTAVPAIQTGMCVRRLMPVECERLQGMPDNHTLIAPDTADGPRYKAIGNSKAVPVVRWLGQRIQAAVRP